MIRRAATRRIENTDARVVIIATLAMVESYVIGAASKLARHAAARTHCA
jgi:hypothetical protein